MKKFFIFVMASLIFTQSKAFGQWDSDGNYLCRADNIQNSPVIVGDGVGGFISAWDDYRNGINNCDIYAQRMNANGQNQWLDNGIQIVGLSGHQRQAGICVAGNNGAIIAWQDEIAGRIYAQRVTGDGTKQWNPEVLLTPGVTTGNQTYPRVIADGVGGAIVIWLDTRNGQNDIFVQRVDANGNILWGNLGVRVDDAVVGGQRDYDIVSDGAQGAIVSWRQPLDAWTGSVRVWRVLSNGQRAWFKPATIADGNAQYTQRPAIASDGLGGSYVIWFDGDPNWKVMCRRVTSTGGLPWSAVEISGRITQMPAGLGPHAQIVSSGSNTATVVWRNVLDQPPPTKYQVFIQRINSAGQITWAVGGKVIFDGAWSNDGVEYNIKWPQIAYNSTYGDVFVAWQYYTYNNFTWDSDIYGQGHYNPSCIDGTIWPINQGTRLCWAESEQWLENREMPRITSSTFGPSPSVGAIAVWTDFRNPTWTDIYANRFAYSGPPPCNPAGGQSAGRVGFENSEISLSVFPNPIKGFTNIQYFLERGASVSLKVYNIQGQEVTTLASGEQFYGMHTIPWDVKSKDREKLSQGIYFLRLDTREKSLIKKLTILR